MSTTPTPCSPETPEQIRSRFKQMGAILPSEIRCKTLSTQQGDFIVHKPWAELRAQMESMRPQLAIAPMSQQPRLGTYLINELNTLREVKCFSVTRFLPNPEETDLAAAREKEMKDRAKARAQSTKGRILSSLRRKGTSKPRFVVDRPLVHDLAPALRDFASQ